MHQSGQGIRISRFEFTQAARFHNQPGDFVLQSQLFKHGMRGGPLPCFGFFATGQAKSLKQDHPQLFGRMNIKAFTRQAVNLCFKRFNTAGKTGRQGSQRLHIQQGTLPFHLGQHLRQRQFDAIMAHDVFRQTFTQQLRQPPADRGIFTGISRGNIQWHLTEATLLLALADNLFIAGTLVIEKISRQLVQARRVFPRLQAVGQQHRISNHAGQSDAHPAQYL